MNTNRPEDGWTSFNHKRHQKCFFNFVTCHGMMASWERGRPARTSLAQPRPSPPLGSTGTGAMALLRPGPLLFPPTGWLLQHRTEAQRRPKGQDAGGTPRAPRAITPPLRGSRRSRAARRRLMRWGLAGDFSESRPAPFGKLPFAREPGPCPGVRTIRKRSNEPSWPIGNKNHVPLTRFSGLGTSIHRINRPRNCCTGSGLDSLIGCVSEVIHEPGSGFWESVLKHRRWLNSRR